MKLIGQRRPDLPAAAHKSNLELLSCRLFAIRVLSVITVISVHTDITATSVRFQAEFLCSLL
jgi:hypothetical protein